MIVGVSDKLLMPWLADKEYMDCSDEGEAVAIAGGHYLATGETATVFMSADGFCNALNFLTSWVIPDGIAMHFVISVGRQEDPHKVMTFLLPDILNQLHELPWYDPKKVSFELVEKQS